MLKFSACIEMLYKEVDFYDRFKEAEASGLFAVEFWNWSNKDLRKLKLIKESLSIPISAMCVDSLNE